MNILARVCKFVNSCNDVSQKFILSGANLTKQKSLRRNRRNLRLIRRVSSRRKKVFIKISNVYFGSCY